MNRELDYGATNCLIGDGVLEEGRRKRAVEKQAENIKPWTMTGTYEKSSQLRSQSSTMSCGEKSPFEKASFIEKLLCILDDAESKNFEHIVSWEPDGLSFKVHKIKEFECQILPCYLQQTKLRSFQRQLIKFGFSRIQGGAARGAYQHPKFFKACRDACLSIQKVKPNRGKEAPADLMPPEVELGPMSEHFKQAVQESRPWVRRSAKKSTNNTSAQKPDNLDWFLMASNFHTTASALDMEANLPMPPADNGVIGQGSSCSSMLPPQPLQQECSNFSIKANTQLNNNNNKGVPQSTFQTCNPSPTPFGTSRVFSDSQGGANAVLTKYLPRQLPGSTMDMQVPIFTGSLSTSAGDGEHSYFSGALPDVRPIGCVGMNPILCQGNESLDSSNSQNHHLNNLSNNSNTTTMTPHCIPLGGCTAPTSAYFVGNETSDDFTPLDMNSSFNFCVGWEPQGI